MLEGLEICEVPIRNLERTLRLDSEFYSKENIAQVNSLQEMNATSLCNIASVSDGNHMSISDSFVENGIPYYRGGDIYNPFIEFATNSLKIPYDVFAQTTMVRSHLQKGDVLMSIVGAIIGNVSIVTTDNNATCSCKLAIIRPKEGISSEYLATFLRSKYGQKQIQKFRRGTGQTGLILEDFDQLLIPQVGKDIQTRIQTILNKSLYCATQSARLYDEAEASLLNHIGIGDFTASSNSCNVKALKESFIETGRLDAEYYQPKYDDILHHIQAYKYGSKHLAEICDIKDENFSPKDNTTYKYVELANIGKYGNITGCSQQKGENLPSRARRIVTKDDVVVSSLEGSLDRCALVEEDNDGALCSTGFYVLKSSVLNSETLLVLFKSPLVKELMRKGCSGTILTAIGRQELERIPIPLIRQEIQEEIAQHVQSSISLRKESLQLLEHAKLTVEGAIQNGGGKIVSEYNVLQEKSAMELHIAIYLLLHEVGIISNDVKVKVSNVVCSCKKLSDSFLASGRLDAEYYQPKYDLLFEKLKGFPTATIKDIATIQKSIEPGSDAYQEEGIPFIRVANLSKFGLSNSDVKLDTTQFADTIRPQKDTILLSKDGSVGIAYKMEETQDVITSSAILHLQLTTPNVLPDYLTLVLNSIVVKLQAERDAGGSIIQHWKPSEIENVIIPILPMNEQQMIANKVKQSFKMREDAQDLLLQAKHIIEKTIEK